MSAGPETPRHFALKSSPDTVHWGYFDAGVKPVLAVRSGDIVTVECVNGGPQTLPSGDHDVLPDHRAILDRLTPRIGTHILTGPIAIEGAEEGDGLEVEILAVDFRQDWGFTTIRTGQGALPEEFASPRLWHSAIDIASRIATLPIGGKIALRPFFGIMGVAPHPSRGAQSSVVPAEFGGNIDCKELVAGTSLFLPVWTKSALFSVGRRTRGPGRR